MTQFKEVTEGFYAAGQISPADVAQAKEAGIGLIVNNRPDDEEPGQPAGVEIERAARDAGIAYRAIPVSAAGFAMPQVDAMADALAATDGKVLGFCRSGTRSTLLWALAEAKRGRDPEEIGREAAGAGYDTGPIRRTMEMLADDAGD